jgi:hypothetical protein
MSGSKANEGIRAIVVGLLLATPVSSFGATLVVPTRFSTIQAAIDAAAAGDTVRVLPA